MIRIIGRHQEAEGEREREIKTKVRAVAYSSEVLEETGDDIFIFLNFNSILLVTQVKNISSSEPVGSFHILRPQTSSHLACQKTLFAIHNISPNPTTSNLLTCCLPGSSCHWPGLHELLLHWFLLLPELPQSNLLTVARRIL